LKKIFVVLPLTILVSAFVLSLSLPSRRVFAVGVGVPDYVYEACVSSMTVTKVLVSTTPVAGANAITGWTNQMDTPLLANRIFIQVENNDPKQNLWCNTNAGLLVAGGGIGTGYDIGPSSVTVAGFQSATPNWLNVPLAASAYTGPNFNATVGAFHWYCVTDGVTASTATVIQCY
jgi:hypothetical protein